jgi:hypothetical protein
MNPRLCPKCNGALRDDNKTGICTRTDACRREYRRRYMADRADLRHQLWETSRQAVTAGTIRTIQETHLENPSDHVTRVVTDFCETFTVDRTDVNLLWESKKHLWRKVAHILYFMLNFPDDPSAAEAEREAIETMGVAAYEAGLTDHEVQTTIASARRKVSGND